MQPHRKSCHVVVVVVVVVVILVVSPFENVEGQGSGYHLYVLLHRSTPLLLVSRL